MGAPDRESFFSPRLVKNLHLAPGVSQQGVWSSVGVTGSRVALHRARHESHVVSWAAWRQALAPAPAREASPQLEGCPQAGQFRAG